MAPFSPSSDRRGSLHRPDERETVAPGPKGGPDGATKAPSLAPRPPMRFFCTQKKPRWSRVATSATAYRRLIALLKLAARGQPAVPDCARPIIHWCVYSELRNYS